MELLHSLIFIIKFKLSDQDNSGLSESYFIIKGEG